MPVIAIILGFLKVPKHLLSSYEQLDWQAPDAVVVPAGNGTLVLGCHIGFNELFAAKRINKIPKIIAVQSANCSALAQMFDGNLDEIPKISKQATLAVGIAIAEPIRAHQIINAVRESKGHFITVNESEIIEALKYTAQMGYFIEPTSAATIAGLEKYLQKKEHEKVVSLFSGHGLKSIDKWMKLL
jgi:threonine synthase